MRIKTPSPSYLKGTNGHAILLLHSFTGTNRDVKHLAAELNDQELSRSWLTVERFHDI